MRLEMGVFHVKDVAFSDSTGFADGILHVNKDEVRDLVLEDKHFADVTLDIARPGESVRIVHALDVVEPRYKASGPGCVFPGVLGPPITVGQGRTQRLAGVAVVTVGPPVAGEMTYFREAIIDMSGPGFHYSPFSQTLNLVVEPKGKEDLSSHNPADLEMTDVVSGSKYSQEYNLAVRVAGFKVAAYLAHFTKSLEPNRLDIWELGPVNPSVPKVVYASQISRQQFLYGEAMGWQPTLIHPNEQMDGAVFGSFNMAACLRNASYFYLNDTIVEELYRHHGVDLSFLGILLYPWAREKLEEKERVTSYGAKLLKMIGADGVIITWIGAGGPGVDVMMLCRRCEQMGIKTTLLYPEMARTPDDPGFMYSVSEADAIVSTGNYEQQITLPAVDQVIGGDALLVNGLDAAGPLSLPISQILGATSPLGLARLTGAQY